MFPRLEIMDPALPKAPFRRSQLRHRGDLELWKTTFPDPSTSPGYYTRALAVGRCHVVRAAEVGSWLRAFSRVVSLVFSGLGSDHDESPISLVPFHGFSPVLKSLRMEAVVFPSSQVFGLILSFSLLDDPATVACAG